MPRLLVAAAAALVPTPAAALKDGNKVCSPLQAAWGECVPETKRGRAVVKDAADDDDDAADRPPYDPPPPPDLFGDTSFFEASRVSSLPGRRVKFRPPDDDDAHERLLRAAAETGRADALYNLGVMFDGQGDQEDPAEAARL